MKSVSSPEILKISRFSTCIILAIYRFGLFKKNSIFLGFYRENKEDDLESVLSFDSEMSSDYSENDNSSSESDTE